MSIKIETWGDYACFTRPEMKTERVSYDIITPSAAKGQFYSQPYFGCREFSAHCREWTQKEVPALPVNQDLGYMLHSMDYSDPENIYPRFFRAKIQNGVINLRNCEVIS